MHRHMKFKAAFFVFPLFNCAPEREKQICKAEMGDGFIQTENQIQDNLEIKLTAYLRSKQSKVTKESNI